MNRFIETVTQIRNLRASVNIKPKDEINVEFFTDDTAWAKYLFNSQKYLHALARVKAGEIRDKNSKRPEKSIMGATAFAEAFIPLEGVIDLNDQVKRIQKEIDKIKTDESKVLAKLSNPNFVDRAPEEVINEVREKAKLFQEKRSSLEENLKLFQ